MQKKLLLLLAVCWLFLVAWPSSRETLRQCWGSPSSMPVWAEEALFDFWGITGKKPVRREWDKNSPAGRFWARALRRAPRDWRVPVMEWETLEPTRAARFLDRQLQFQPNDLTLLSWRLEMSSTLNLPTSTGPLFNPDWPKPPRSTTWYGPSYSPSPASEWLALLVLARRGQKLEPNNSYWDWAALRSLVALNRQREIESLLGAAQRKTVYYARRDEIQSQRLQVVESVAPDLLARYRSSWQTHLPSLYFSTTHDTARHVCQLVMFTRDARRHSQALGMSTLR